MPTSSVAASDGLMDALRGTHAYQFHQAVRLEGRRRGSLIRCSFEAHSLDCPVENAMVLLAAHDYRLKSALFDFGWGYRNHFSNHPHPLHVLPPGQGFRWIKDGPAHITLLTLELDSLDDLFGELDLPNPVEGLWQLAQRGFPDPMIYLSLSRFLHHASAAGNPALLIDSYCALILAELGQRWRRRPESRVQRKLAPRVLARVVAHMQERLADDLELDELAAIGGLSKYHFLRCFAASTGRSPYAYLTDLRLARAERLLATTEEPIDQVARRCGFAGSAGLGRAFRKASGLSPKVFRERASRDSRR